MRIRSKRIDRYVLEHGLQVAGWVRYASAPREHALVPVQSHVSLPHEVDRILGIQLFTLGDLVMTVPALRTLRRWRPDAHLTVLVLPQLVEFARRFADVDEVLSIRGRRPLGALRDLRAQRPDLAVAFNPYVLSAWIAAASGARTKVGYVHCPENRRDQRLGPVGPALLDLPVIPDGEPCHEVERYVALTRVVAEVFDTAPGALYLSSEDIHFAQRFLKETGVRPGRRLIGIHPGGKWVSRRWMPDRIAAVADHAAERLDADVLFWGSRDEFDVVEEVRGLMTARTLSSVGKTGLTEVAALIAACDLILCNNSGPMHVAAGFGVPTVALFGPETETKYHPFQPAQRVVRNPVPCSPCNISYLAPCPNNICMKGLHVEQVREAVDEVIDQWVLEAPARRADTLERHRLETGLRGVAGQ